MAKHDVWITFPAKRLKNTDTVLEIAGADEDAVYRKYGTLEVSRGSADWRPAGKQNVVTIPWERFRDILNEEWSRRYGPV